MDGSLGRWLSEILKDCNIYLLSLQERVWLDIMICGKLRVVRTRVPGVLSLVYLVVAPHIHPHWACRSLPTLPTFDDVKNSTTQRKSVQWRTESSMVA